MKTPLPLSSWMVALCGLLCWPAAAGGADYAEVAVLLQEHCADCHSDPDEADGGWLMRTREEVLGSGESAQAVVPGDAEASLLVRYLEGRVDEPGRKKIMPPGRRAKLSPQEIARVRAWIDAGAPAASVVSAPRTLEVPEIPVAAGVRAPVTAMASGEGEWLAVARGRSVEVRRGPHRDLAARLVLEEPVTAMAFLPGGERLAVAAGQAGLRGRVTVHRLPKGTVEEAISAHDDLIHSLAVSPDGRRIASGSYDQQIRLWTRGDGGEPRTLKGHNGAVFGLAFRPDGRVLASAGADRTIKLWDADSGERLDTLSQPLKEQNAVAWLAGGRLLVAVGADGRLRFWEISAGARETTNVLQDTVFGHEGSILALAAAPAGGQIATSGSEGTVKVWDALSRQMIRQWPQQPDWPQALAFVRGDVLAVGRADGAVSLVSTASGEEEKGEPPVVRGVWPPVVSAGVRSRVVLSGEKFHHLRSASSPAGQAELVGTRGGSEATLEVVAEAPGEMVLRLHNAAGESAPVKLAVESLPAREAAGRVDLPVCLHGRLDEAGTEREVTFSAEAGEDLVFIDRSAELGSKAELALSLSGPSGAVAGFDGRVHQVTEGGEHRLRVRDRKLGGSAEHFFVMSAGRLPLVTGVTPLVVPAGREARVRLLGVNLPAEEVTLPPAEGGELAVPLPEGVRSLRPLKVAVRSAAVLAAGDFVLEREDDRPVLKFPARAGTRLVAEAFAARGGSPVDSRLEILHLDGRPVQSVRLQATRQTQQAFRGINSVQDSDFRVDQWEEMELRQFLYCRGEVVRLFRAPQGPDSGFTVFSRNGMRRTYFNTTAASHAVEEPYYIVRPLAPEEPPLSNGLPVFTLHCENDDDPEREWGTDSRLMFDPPADGDYLLRVSDSRGFHGPDHAVHVSVREAAPAISVALRGLEAGVLPGCGLCFEVALDRIDGFSGPVEVEFRGLPEGWTMTSPLLVEDDHLIAHGSLQAPENAEAYPSGARLAFTARAPGAEGISEAHGESALPPLKEQKPGFRISLEPPEVRIRPGGLATARLRVERLSEQGIFNLEVLNLPHGVIVNNIGLNGVQIAAGETEREIEFACERWVAPCRRMAFPVLKGGKGLQSGPPVTFDVLPAEAPLTAEDVQ